MRVTVWHRKLGVWERTFAGRAPAFPEDFEPVAVVEVADIGEVFQLTNHIDHDWMTNPEVVERLAPLARSTSVGDIYTTDTAAWRVAPVGLEPVGLEPALG